MYSISSILISTILVVLGTQFNLSEALKCYSCDGSSKCSSSSGSSITCSANQICFERSGKDGANTVRGCSDLTECLKMNNQADVASLNCCGSDNCNMKDDRKKSDSGVSIPNSEKSSLTQSNPNSARNLVSSNIALFFSSALTIFASFYL